MKKASYVPEPRVVETPYLVGALYFPGWKEDAHFGWGKITPYPERRPYLGWYDEHDPEVADWEVKWALEHGISFFAYCWYRNGVGTPVTTGTIRLGHAIHEALTRSRYLDRFRFCIMWENQGRKAGIASMEDLKESLLPFWMEEYFLHPSYLKVENKPVLKVYRWERLIEDMGGADVGASFQQDYASGRQKWLARQ